MASTTQDIGAYEISPFKFYVDDSVSGGAEDGSSWPDAFPTLQQALDACLPGDQIFIAEGFYTPERATDSSDPRTKTFALKRGLSLYGGYTGDGTLGNTLSNPTVLSGDLTGDDDGSASSMSENAYQHLSQRYAQWESEQKTETNSDEKN